MQTEYFVTHAHLLCREVDVLQTIHIADREGEVSLDNARSCACAQYLVIVHTAQGNISGVVDNALELTYGLHKIDNHLMVKLLRRDAPTAEGREIGLLAHTLLRGLGKKQIAFVIEIRTLVEMTLESAVEKRETVLIQFRLIFFRNKPVLLMHNGVMRQYLDSLAPCGVNSLVFL